MRTGEVVRDVLALAHPQQLFAELAAIEPVAAVADDCLECARNTGTAQANARTQGPIEDERLPAVDGEGRERARKEWRRGEAQFGVGPCRLQHRRARELAEPLVQCQPPVDTPRHGHGADITPNRHAGCALGAKARRVGA